jgi:hypothetical protein
MTEPGIGRILVASLHQAISELLPMRLEFYENWLNPWGMRHGRIGRAQLNAVLSFLRQEGAVYQSVTRRAGEYAAEWTASAQWPITRVAARSLPAWLRARVVLRQTRRLVRSCGAGSRAVVRLRKGRGTVDLRDSVFCTVRDTSSEQLCGFYAAAATRLFQLYGVPGEARPGKCRAVGDPACLLEMTIDGRSASGLTSATDAR